MKTSEINFKVGFKNRLVLLTLALLLAFSKADFFSTGLSLVTGGNSPQNQENLMKDALPYLFDMLTKMNYNEFPFEGGRLTNINIQVVPPKSWDQVKIDVFSDTIFFQIGGLGAKIGADFEILIKKRPATGHMDIDITNLGINIRLKNEPLRGSERKVGAEIKLDLEHTHGDIKLSTQGSIEEIKGYLFNLVKEEAKQTFSKQAQNYMPEWASGWGWKVGAQSMGPIHYALNKRTQQIVDQYFAENPDYQVTNYANQPHGYTTYKIGGGEAPRVLADYGNYVVTKQTTQNTIKDRLQESGGRCIFDDDDDDDENRAHMSLKDKLSRNTQHIERHAQSTKLNYLLPLETYSKLFVQRAEDQPVLNKDMVKKLIEKDPEIPKKIENYFGDKVVFECKPKDNEMKARAGENGSIIGTYTVVCKLDTVKPSKETPYSMELNLEFTIHPDIKEEGKSPRDSFGSFSMADMRMTREGNMQINARVSDQPEKEMFFPDYADLFGDLFAGLG